MEISLIAKHLLWFLLLLISLTLHEWGHAFVAYKLGDNTPYQAGRVTLNPLAHIDILGTILFPLLCIFTSAGILFGWGRPVPMEPAHFKRRELYTMFAGCAGLLGNLCLCLIASFILAFAQNYYILGYSLLELNAFLIAFNLFPIPGLDGFYLIKYGLKLSQSTVEFLEHWGFFIVLILINIPIVRTILSLIVHSIVAFFIQVSVMFYSWIA